ncbi:hypothetical protein B7P43_G01530, partial [Cryptotermes secundus]
LFRAAVRDISVTGKRRISTTTTAAIQQGFGKITKFASRHYGHKHPETEFDSDSDSRNHHQREKGKSEFWLRKMRTFHGVIDVNKDGIVSYDDFLILAKRFVTLGHLSENQEREFQEILKEVWEKQWGAPDCYNLVKTEQYLENMQHVLSDPSLKRKVHNFLPYLFKAVDRDKDGVISVEEFKLFFECLGLEEKVK